MTKLARLAPLCGALASVLWLVSIVVLEAGGNPADSSSRDEVAQHFFVGAEFAFAVFVGAIALIALARTMLPRWIGWTGLPSRSCC